MVNTCLRAVYVCFTTARAARNYSKVGRLSFYQADTRPVANFVTFFFFQISEQGGGGRRMSRELPNLT